MTLLVVRHAHAGDRGRWDGDDRLRPLSVHGQAQAKSLAAELAPHAPVRILSSPTVRCRQTVEPLADEVGIAVVDDDRLFEGAVGDAVRSILDQVGDDRTTVLCSHGDVIPMLLHELEVRGMTTDGTLRWQKASTWVVERDGHGWGAGRYLAPPAPG